VSFVVDNSVALAWCFEDEQTQPIMDLLDRVAETGAVAPSLWPLEALNGLLMAERRKRLDAKRRQRLAGFLRGLPVLRRPRPEVESVLWNNWLREDWRTAEHRAASLRSRRHGRRGQGTPERAHPHGYRRK
jgi:predicted nucleic acid-binding protein